MLLGAAKPAAAAAWCGKCLHPWYRAADELPSPTPDQVSYLPPATADAACLARGWHSLPLRSRSPRCTTWQLSKAVPSVCQDTARVRCGRRRACWGLLCLCSTCCRQLPL